MSDLEGDKELARDIEGVSALAEPTRRALYLYVCAQPHPVSREQAAEAVGAAVHTAKFHLDRLEQEGLLESSYARTSGRTGPGAGRSSKLYRRSDREIAVSLPDRDYALAGKLMAQAITESARTGEAVSKTLGRVATDAGAALARDTDAADADDALEIARAVLRSQGYEPRWEGQRIVMANCPFHDLAQAHTGLVCGMNHDLLCGFAESLAPGELDVVLDPAPNRCCVTIGRRAREAQSNG
ncbi:Predicted transcriptional regulator, ArsR family [Paramicrobacterium humi]|uniref:Predicted transcriptional regulator, ArsR family n=1 Tax=Paramicrobacterium humi TaxID=640635 RepID=A0A1H4ITT2_9MICO|nr:helix-turn-helix domain-containing protein [Microbacterium humi]SEB37046.1 Predicted transcriptional regulator, ArsR family [Microbacterium humi]